MSAQQGFGLVLRRLAIAAGAAIVVSAGTPSKAAPAPFQALAYVEETRILTGTYAGGFLVAPSGELNWYFANLGLYPFVTVRPGEIGAYLDLYLKNLDGDFAICDVTSPLSAKPVLNKPDSDDAYAATFLSLAVAYARVGGGATWFQQHLATLKSIAYRNLALAQKPSGLIKVFQHGDAASHTSYTEDDCEDYRGLADFAGELKDLGDPDWAYYNHVAASLAMGIQTVLFSTAQNAFFVTDQRLAIGTRFYPYAVTQVFPQLDGVPLGKAITGAEYTDGWDYFTKAAPFWASQGSRTFPWMLLGYVAAMRDHPKMAMRQMALLRTLVASSTTRQYVTIEELGYYRRIADLLGPTAEAGSGLSGG